MADHFNLWSYKSYIHRPWDCGPRSPTVAVRFTACPLTIFIHRLRDYGLRWQFILLLSLQQFSFIHYGTADRGGTGAPNDHFLLKISVRRSKNCLEFSMAWGSLKIPRWPFHSCTIFEAYLINPLTIFWSLIFAISLPRSKRFRSKSTLVA